MSQKNKLTKKEITLEEAIYKDIIKQLYDRAKFKIFREPVDVNTPGCEKYYEIIQEPMCLSQLMDIYKNGQLKYAKNVRDKLILIGENCKSFNRNFPSFVNLGDEFIKKSKELFKKLGDSAQQKNFDMDKELEIDKEALDEIDQKKVKKLTKQLDTFDIPQQTRTILPSTQVERLSKKSTVKKTPNKNKNSLSQSQISQQDLEDQQSSAQKFESSQSQLPIQQQQKSLDIQKGTTQPVQNQEQNQRKIQQQQLNFSQQQQYPQEQLQGQNSIRLDTNFQENSQLQNQDLLQNQSLNQHQKSSVQKNMVKENLEKDTELNKNKSSNIISLGNMVESQMMSNSNIEEQSQSQNPLKQSKQIKKKKQGTKVSSQKKTTKQNKQKKMELQYSSQLQTQKENSKENELQVSDFQKKERQGIQYPKVASFNQFKMIFPIEIFGDYINEENGDVKQFPLLFEKYNEIQQRQKIRQEEEEKKRLEFLKEKQRLMQIEEEKRLQQQKEREQQLKLEIQEKKQKQEQLKKKQQEIQLKIQKEQQQQEIFQQNQQILQQQQQNTNNQNKKNNFKFQLTNPNSQLEETQQSNIGNSIIIPNTFQNNNLEKSSINSNSQILLSNKQQSKKQNKQQQQQQQLQQQQQQLLQQKSQQQQQYVQPPQLQKDSSSLKFSINFDEITAPQPQSNQKNYRGYEASSTKSQKSQNSYNLKKTGQNYQNQKKNQLSLKKSDSKFVIPNFQHEESLNQSQFQYSQNKSQNLVLNQPNSLGQSNSFNFNSLNQNNKMIINNNNNDIVFEDSGINNEFSNNMDIEYNMYPNQEDQQYEGYSDDDEERERKIKELQEKKMREHEERIEKLNALKREEQRKREQEEREKREKEERNRRIIEEEKRKIEEQKKLALQKIQSNYEEKLQKLKSKYQDIDDFDEDYNQSLLSDLSAQLPQPDSNQLINQNQNQNFEFQNQQENIENSLNESIQQVSQNRPGQQIIKQSQFSNNGLNLQNNDDNNNNVCYIGGDFQMEKDIQNIQNQNRMSEIDKKNSDLNMNLDSSSNLLGYQKQVKDNKMDLDLNQENQNQQLNKNQQELIYQQQENNNNQKNIEKSIKNNIDFDDIMGNYEGQEVQETQNNEFTQPNFNTNSDIIVNDINKKQSFNLQEDLNNKEKQKKQYLKLSGIFESDSDENLYTKQEKTENEVQKNKGQLENIKDINNYQINSNKLSLDQQKQQLEEMKQKLTQQQQKNTSQNINNQIQKISQNKEQNQQTQKIQSASKGQNIDYSQYDDNLIEQELEKELEIQDKQLLKQQLQQEQQLLDSQIKNKFKKQENIQMEQVKGQLLGQLNEEQNKNKEDEKQKEIEKKQKQQELENKKNMLLEFQKFAQQKQPTNNNINQQNTNQIQQLEQEKNNLLQHNQLLNEKRKLEQSLLENNLNKDQSTKIQDQDLLKKKNKQNESQVGIQNTKTSYTTPEKEQSGLASLLNQQLPQGQEGKLLDLFSQEKNQNQSQKINQKQAIQKKNENNFNKSDQKKFGQFDQKQKSYFSETHLQQQQQSLKETLFDEFLDDSLTIKKKTKQNQNQLEYIPKKHKRKNNFHKEKYQASPQQDSFSRQKKKRLVNFDNYQQQFGLRLLKKREKKKKRRDQEKREREEREKKKKEKEKKEKKEKEKRQREKEKSSSRQNRSSSSQQKQSKDQKERERSREIEIEKINKINEKARQEKSRSIQRENQPLQQQFQQQQNINQGTSNNSIQNNNNKNLIQQQQQQITRSKSEERAELLRQKEQFQQFQQQIKKQSANKEQKIEKIESKSKDVSGSKVSMSKENTDGQKNQEFQKLEDYKKQLQSIFNNTKPQQQNDAKENNNQIQTQQLQQKIQKQQQTLQGKKVHLSKEERLKKLEEQLKKQMMEQVNQVQQKFTQPQSQNLIVMLNKDEIQQDFKNFATQKQKKYEYLLKKYMKKIEEEIDRIFENSNYSLSIVLNDLKSKYLEDKCIENALINQDTRFFQLFLKMLCYWLRDFHEDLKEDIINNLKCCSKKMISVLNRFLFYNQLMAKPWTEQQRLENKMLTQNQSQNYQITQPYIDLNMDQSNYENSENQMEQSYYYNYTNNTANQSAIYTKELNEYENKMKIFRRDLDKDKKNIEPSKMRENQGAEPQKKDKKQGTKVVIPNNNNLLGQQDLFSNLGFLPKKKEVDPVLLFIQNLNKELKDISIIQIIQDRIKGVQQEEKEGKRRYEHEFLGNLDPIQKKVKLNKENEEQNQESDMKSKKKKMVQNQQQQDIQGLQADLKINVNKDNVEKIINDRQQAQIESEQLLVENLKNSQFTLKLNLNKKKQEKNLNNKYQLIEQEIPYDFQEESEEIDSMEIEEDQNQEEFKNRYQDDEEQKYGENLQYYNKNSRNLVGFYTFANYNKNNFVYTFLEKQNVRMQYQDICIKYNKIYLPNFSDIKVKKLIINQLNCSNQEIMKNIEEFNNIIRKDNVLSKISKSKTELIDFLQINCLMILEFNFPLEEREMDWEDDIQEQKQQLQMIENQEEQKEQNISQKNQQKQIQIQQLLDENLHEFQKQFNINNPLSPETFNEFQQLQKNQKNLELQLAENGFQLLKLNPYVANEQVQKYNSYQTLIKMLNLKEKVFCSEGNLYLQESIKINGNNKFICLKLYFPVENPNKLEINIENRKIFPPNLQMLE